MIIRKLRRAGGSLSLVIPGDLVELLGWDSETELALSLDGQSVILTAADVAMPLAKVKRGAAKASQKKTKTAR